jgi:hypothetical protein
LEARLTNLLYEKIIVVKSKEVKTESNLGEPSEECYGLEGAVLPMMMICVTEM